MMVHKYYALPPSIKKINTLQRYSAGHKDAAYIYRTFIFLIHSLAYISVMLQAIHTSKVPKFPKLLLIKATSQRLTTVLVYIYEHGKLA